MSVLFKHFKCKPVKKLKYNEDPYIHLDSPIVNILWQWPSLSALSPVCITLSENYRHREHFTPKDLTMDLLKTGIFLCNHNIIIVFIILTLDTVKEYELHLVVLFLSHLWSRKVPHTILKSLL